MKMLFLRGRWTQEYLCKSKKTHIDALVLKHLLHQNIDVCEQIFMRVYYYSSIHGVNMTEMIMYIFKKQHTCAGLAWSSEGVEACLKFWFSHPEISRSLAPLLRLDVSRPQPLDFPKYRSALMHVAHVSPRLQVLVTAYLKTKTSQTGFLIWPYMVPSLAPVILKYANEALWMVLSQPITNQCMDPTGHSS